MGEQTGKTAGKMDVRYIADLARIHLSDREADEFQAQLGRIVEYFNDLRGLELVGNAEPMAHATLIQNVFRDDVCRPGLDHERVMSNAPQRSADLFVVPRILE